MAIPFDWTTLVIIAVIVILLYMVCIRRRRKVVVLSTHGASTTTTGNSMVQEEIITTMTTSTTFSKRDYSNEDFVDSKTIYKMFKTTNIKSVAEQFSSLDEVGDAMRRAGLEKCHLIFGVDYTASNYWQGKKTFGSKSLHDITTGEENPYQKVIGVLGETLESFDSTGVIPAFGFGDMTTRDNSIFPLRSDGLCNGFKDVLQVYNQITPRVKLSGPTNFAPLINQAVEIVRSSQAYHILVIVADGQVTSDRATTAAIVNASNWPLSIIMVGVGDGPWDTMDEFDQKLQSRRFDNFHFVDFHHVTDDVKNPSASFALHALMEIPDQYKAIKKLGLLDFD